MFSTLRQGNLLFILTVGDNEEPSLTVGQMAEDVRPASPRYNTSMQFGAAPEMVVDLKVNTGSAVKEFKQVPANLSIANFGQGVVISESREAMAQEIESIARNSEQIINSVEHHKTVLSGCNKLLRQLNPAFAKDQERQEEFESLKSEVGGIKSDLGEIRNMLMKLSGVSN